MDEVQNCSSISSVTEMAMAERSPSRRYGSFVKFFRRIACFSAVCAGFDRELNSRRRACRFIASQAARHGAVGAHGMHFVTFTTF